MVAMYGLTGFNPRARELKSHIFGPYTQRARQVGGQDFEFAYNPDGGIPV